MLHFEYYAHSCFLFHFGEVKVLLDPYNPEIGHKIPVRSADYVCISHDHFDHNNIKAVSGRTTVIRGGVSRKLGPVSLTAVLADHDAHGQRGLVTIFKLQAGEGPAVVHLSDLGVPLSAEQIGEIGQCDVLLAPVGGCGYTLDAAGALQVASQLKPRLLLPMHYRTPFLSRSLFPECDGLDKFLKLAPSTHKLEKAQEGKVKLDRLPEKATAMIVPYLY